MYYFNHRDRLSKKVSCLLNKEFPVVGIFRYNHTRHTRKAENIYFAERATSYPDHINRLVEMLIHVHSFFAGNLYGFIYNPLEFPIGRIAHCSAKVTGTPILISVFVLSPYILK